MPTIISVDIKEAARLLIDNLVIAIPTETVYGLAANALNENAVQNIFTLKNRPANNPLIVHTHSIEEAKKYVREVPDEIAFLMHTFCPGPITFLLPRNNSIPDITCSGSALVGIRIPKHELTLQLLRLLPFPLAAPSANKYGYLSPTIAASVPIALQMDLAFVLDGGACEVGIESTIVEWANDTIKIHRLGGISEEQLHNALPNARIIINDKADANKTLTPGKSLSHYSPKTKMIVGDIQKLIPQYEHLKIGIISMQKTFKLNFSHCIKLELLLSTEGDEKIFAQKLYASLLKLDQAGVDIILCEWVSNNGFGKAINDRLFRASYQHKQL